ncbi:hypothetical protein [Novosphingobium sp. PC22D]|uniref:hypothetical protein n=1 Tax=Novosphingobium sp. PC22D TaxID=1962403 RepID=UPI00114526F9|nr:hypothetical protein [Novosphingobium sp. PC22D]
MANLIEATERLTSLKRLPKGWDYGRGGPISAKAYSSGLMLLQMLAKLGATAFDVVPGDDDGATIVAYHNGKSAEIHCLSNKKYDLLHELENGEEELKEALSIAGLVFALESYGWRSPRFYASCTLNAMFQESDDSAGLHFGTLPVAGSQLLAPTASRKMGWKRASTFGRSTMEQSAENRLSSGEYRSLRFLPALA